jgi:hypothetical protein
MFLGTKSTLIENGRNPGFVRFNVSKSWAQHPAQNFFGGPRGGARGGGRNPGLKVIYGR